MVKICLQCGGDLGSIPGLGRCPGEGNSYPHQYSGLENSMDCILHGVSKSWTWLSDFHQWLNNKCFTMLCWFLLYNKVTQLQITYIPSLLSLPPIHVHPTPLGCNTAASWLPMPYSSFLLSIVHMVAYICQCYSCNSSHHLLPPLCPQAHSLHLHLYSCPWAPSLD